MYCTPSGIQRLIAQEEASRGERRRDRFPRHNGRGEDGGAEEGNTGAAAATRQGALGTGAGGG